MRLFWLKLMAIRQPFRHLKCCPWATFAVVLDDALRADEAKGPARRLRPGEANIPGSGAAVAGLPAPTSAAEPTVARAAAVCSNSRRRGSPSRTIEVVLISSLIGFEATLPQSQSTTQSVRSDICAAAWGAAEGSHTQIDHFHGQPAAGVGEGWVDGDIENVGNPCGKFPPRPGMFGSGNSILCGSDMIAAEVEQVIDLIVG